MRVGFSGLAGLRNDELHRRGNAYLWQAVHADHSGLAIDARQALTDVLQSGAAAGRGRGAAADAPRRLSLTLRSSWSPTRSALTSAQALILDLRDVVDRGATALSAYFFGPRRAASSPLSAAPKVCT